jgi:ring-1,2-phenylacetyl-CoA epoxidase subunit PaaD
MVRPLEITRNSILDLLSIIKDPEIPVVTIKEIGLLRDVNIQNGHIEIIVTPTYNSCPAIEIIMQDIRFILKENLINNFNIVLDPCYPWSTDDISEETKSKLKAYGIAPPVSRSTCNKYLNEKIQCPRCDCYDTQLISHFGSTLCKALYKCNHCMESFDYFKCH